MNYNRKGATRQELAAQLQMGRAVVDALKEQNVRRTSQRQEPWGIGRYFSRATEMIDGALVFLGSSERYR